MSIHHQPSLQFWTYLEGVQDPQVKNSINLQRHIICHEDKGTHEDHMHSRSELFPPKWILAPTQRNCRLLRHVNHDLLQTLHVANPVQDGYEEVQALKEKWG